MIDVPVADHSCIHGRQSAVSAACVEGEVKLRQQNHGPVSGARSTNHDQLPPAGVELEAAETR